MQHKLFADGKVIRYFVFQIGSEDGVVDVLGIAAVGTGEVCAGGGGGHAVNDGDAGIDGTVEMLVPGPEGGRRVLIGFPGNAGGGEAFFFMQKIPEGIAFLVGSDHPVGQVLIRADRGGRIKFTTVKIIAAELGGDSVVCAEIRQAWNDVDYAADFHRAVHGGGGAFENFKLFNACHIHGRHGVREGAPTDDAVEVGLLLEASDVGIFKLDAISLVVLGGDAADVPKGVLGSEYTLILDDVSRDDFDVERGLSDGGVGACGRRGGCGGVAARAGVVGGFTFAGDDDGFHLCDAVSLRKELCIRWGGRCRNVYFFRGGRDGGGIGAARLGVGGAVYDRGKEQAGQEFLGHEEPCGIRHVG